MLAEAVHVQVKKGKFDIMESVIETCLKPATLAGKREKFGEVTLPGTALNKHVKKGKFHITGVCMIETCLKPATVTGKMEKFGEVCVVSLPDMALNENVRKGKFVIAGVCVIDHEHVDEGGGEELVEGRHRGRRLRGRSWRARRRAGSRTPLLGDGAGEGGEGQAREGAEQPRGRGRAGGRVRHEHADEGGGKELVEGRHRGRRLRGRSWRARRRAGSRTPLLVDGAGEGQVEQARLRLPGQV